MAKYFEKIKIKTEDNFSKIVKLSYNTTFLIFQEFKDAVHKWLILCPFIRLLVFIMSVQCSRAINESFQSMAAHIISSFLELRTITILFSSALGFPRTSFSSIEYPSLRVIDLSVWTLTIIANQVQTLASLIFKGYKHGLCLLMYQRIFIGHPHYHINIVGVQFIFVTTFYYN